METVCHILIKESFHFAKSSCQNNLLACALIKFDVQNIQFNTHRLNLGPFKTLNARFEMAGINFILSIGK